MQGNGGTPSFDHRLAFGDGVMRSVSWCVSSSFMFGMSTPGSEAFLLFQRPLLPWSQPISVPGSDTARLLRMGPAFCVLSAPERSRGTKPLADLEVLVLLTTTTDGLLTRCHPI